MSAKSPFTFESLSAAAGLPINPEAAPFPLAPGDGICSNSAQILAAIKASPGKREWEAMQDAGAAKLREQLKTALDRRQLVLADASNFSKDTRWTPTTNISRPSPMTTTEPHRNPV